MASWSSPPPPPPLPPAHDPEAHSCPCAAGGALPHGEGLWRAQTFPEGPRGLASGLLGCYLASLHPPLPMVKLSSPCCRQRPGRGRGLQRGAAPQGGQGLECCGVGGLSHGGLVLPWQVLHPVCWWRWGKPHLPRCTSPGLRPPRLPGPGVGARGCCLGQPWGCSGEEAQVPQAHPAGKDAAAAQHSGWASLVPSTAFPAPRRAAPGPLSSSTPPFLTGDFSLWKLLGKKSLP